MPYNPDAPVSTILEYVNLVSGKPLYASVYGDQPDYHLEDFHWLVSQQLTNAAGETPFATYLKSLSAEQKEKLITALITNDNQTFTRMLLQSPLADVLNENGMTASDLNKITAHENREAAVNQKEWVSVSVRRMIATMLLTPDNKSMNERDRLYLHIHSLSKIPDTAITVGAKLEITKSIDSEVEAVRTAYSEPIKPLRANRERGSISNKQYEQIIRLDNTVLSQSDFIMLTLGVLQKHESNLEIKTALNKIRRYYLMTDFSACINEIDQICTNHADLIGIRLAEKIRIESSNFTRTTTQNYSRRFFENRLASLYQGTSINVEAIGRIGVHFGMAMPTDSLLATKVVTTLAESDDEKAMDRMNELKAKDPNWAIRGRRMKAGYKTRGDEVGENVVSDTVLSRNLGVMMSNQPAYRDELSEHAIRNAPADTNLSAGYGYYGYNREQSSFVASLSGHAYFTAAILERYMAANSNSPTLNQDINDYVQAFLMSYVGRGYHGVLEIIDAFYSPGVKEAFENYGVRLSFNYANDLLASAFKDTQTYTARLAARQLVHQELTEKHTFDGLISSQNYDGLVKYINNPRNDLNEQRSNGNTLLHDLITSNFSSGQKEALITMLLDKNVKVNVENTYHEQPLTLAASENLAGVVKLLVTKGASVDTSMIEAIGRYSVTHDASLLLMLLEAGAAEKVDLTKQKMRAFNEEYNPLVFSMMNQKFDVAARLLETNQFNPNELIFGLTIVGVAIKTDNTEGPILLDTVLKTKGFDINKKDENGDTPIMIAVNKGDLQTIRKLLAHPGIDFNVKNKQGHSVKELAKFTGNGYIFQEIGKAAAMSASKSSHIGVFGTQAHSSNEPPKPYEPNQPGQNYRNTRNLK